jgi:hypothetical protein
LTATAHIRAMDFSYTKDVSDPSLPRTTARIGLRPGSRQPASSR